LALFGRRPHQRVTGISIAGAFSFRYGIPKSSRRVARRRRNRRAYGALRFNIDLLAERLVDATSEKPANEQTSGARPNYVVRAGGASTEVVRMAAK
jgi:hypothetical protein